MQRGDVLFQRLLLDASTGLGLDRSSQLDICTIRCFNRLQIRELILQHRLGRIKSGSVLKTDLDGLIVARNTRMAHIFLSQAGAQITCKGLGTFGQRRLHVNLQHEMHTTTQIQTEVHG